MNILESIKARHSVRSYTEKKIDGQVLQQLREAVEACNRESGLHMQLCLNEPRAFTSMMARLGKFKNVKNYIALVGKVSDDLEGKCGYYGEKIVLHATQLGLNTCWVAVTYGKGRCPAVVGAEEKLVIVIAIGYGATNGVPHKVKDFEALSSVQGSVPAWFKRGVEAAQLAPTAVNQQRFCFELQGNTVKALPGSGSYTKIDLGIVKYHFEIGAGDENWQWHK